jgi:ketosteroid isomerase-like protein
MSQNMAVSRRLFETWQRDDFEGWIGLLDPEIEWLTGPERELGGALYCGHEGARELWNLWRTEVEDFSIETDEIRDLGGERVLHLAHFRWRGPSSGIVVESQLALVQTLRDGKIVRSMDYMSHSEALKAVGLAE